MEVQVERLLRVELYLLFLQIGWLVVDLEDHLLVALQFAELHEGPTPRRDLLLLRLVMLEFKEEGGTLPLHVLKGNVQVDLMIEDNVRRSSFLCFRSVVRVKQVCPCISHQDGHERVDVVLGILQTNLLYPEGDHSASDISQHCLVLLPIRDGLLSITADDLALSAGLDGCCGHVLARINRENLRLVACKERLEDRLQHL
mmetsp:Transcript_22386/g.45200  ORF Transcript_22386/g.45200 Transcript_22386/m.45200 type:complete len:200 (+) Transcript_22386:238-837(+)